MRIKSSRRLWPMTLLLLAVTAAHAGVDVTTRTEGKGRGAGRMRAAGDRLRIDSETPPSGAGATSILFDAAEEKLRILRHDEQSYVEIDQGFLDRVGAQVAEAQKEIERQLAQMPPAQRAMMEKMMKGGALPLARPGAATEPAPLVVAPTEETDTVGGIPCSVYTLKRDGRSLGDACVASWDAVGIDPSDVAVLKKLAAFQKKISVSLGRPVAGREEPFELLERVDGFPLRTRRMERGEVASTTFFENLEKADVPAATFEIPAGYAKREVDPRRPPAP